MLETAYKTAKMFFHGLLSVFLHSIFYCSGVALNSGAHPAEYEENMAEEETPMNEEINSSDEITPTNGIEIIIADPNLTPPRRKTDNKTDTEDHCKSSDECCSLSLI